jgi:hypothetical protein
MKAIEFQSELRFDQTLAVPASALDAIPFGTPVRVLVLISQSGDDAEWERFAAEDESQARTEQVGGGYQPSSALNDETVRFSSR